MLQGKATGEPLPSEEVAGALVVHGFVDRHSRAEFRRIRANSAERAAGPEAERHRFAAFSFARGFGMTVHLERTPFRFNWDGTVLNAATEVCHLA